MITTTQYRFAKMINIPANQLDTVLVDQLIGSNKNLKKSYQMLYTLTIIREIAKDNGKSLQDVLNWLEQP